LFSLYSGDLIGLETDRNHLVFRWNNERCKILFSASKKGSSLSCHFASDKSGLRFIKRAINDFIKFAFDKLSWCVSILAIVEKPSVKRLIERLNFIYVGDIEGCAIYLRGR
jgi:hypothetical protein